MAVIDHGEIAQPLEGTACTVQVNRISVQYEAVDRLRNAKQEAGGKTVFFAVQKLGKDIGLSTTKDGN